MKRNSEYLRKYIMDNRILISGKKIVLVSILVLLIGFMTMGKVLAEDRQKGDTNGDGKITVSDISILKAHLVGIKEIESYYRTYADMNGDGKISVTDLSSLKIELVGLGNRELTEDEKSDINKYINENYEFLSRGSSFYTTDSVYGVSENFNLKNISFIEEMIKTCSIINKNSIKYTNEELENLYLQLSGQSKLAGGEVSATTFTDLKNMYKKQFNVDVDNEYIKQRCKEYNEHKNQDGIYYIEEKDLVLAHPEWTVALQKDIKLLEGSVQNSENFNLKNISFIEEVIKICSIINKNSIKYTNEELENLYLQLSGQSKLAGGEVSATTFTDLKNMYKKQFNVDVDNEYIKQRCKEYNEHIHQNGVYYIEEKDLVLAHPEWTVALQKDIKLLEGSVQNNVYRLILEVAYSGMTASDKGKLVLLLNKVGDNYYISCTN